MSMRILLVGSNRTYAKRFKKLFSGSPEFEIIEKPPGIHSISLRSLSSSAIDLVCYAGSEKDSDWIDVETAMANRHWLPVIVMTESDLNKKVSTDVLLRKVTPKTTPKSVTTLAHKLILHGRSIKGHQRQDHQSHSGGLGLAADFFGTIDIHEVLEKTLGHFGNKILCKDIHWIHWKEVQHLANVDGESLNLEVETKYHRTPRLRSWIGEGGARHAVSLAREFPLHSNLSHLETGGFLVQEAGGDKHLMFPLKGSLEAENLSCLLIENLHDGEPEYIVKMMRETLTHLSKHIEFAYQYYEATNLSYIDDLTSLYNQRYLPKVLDGEVSRAQRQNAEFSVLFLDVDHFKKVNDSNGHWIGSKLLVEIGKIIRDSIRSCDFGFRYGGDEYVVVLVDTGKEGAKTVAERLRESIEKSIFLIDGCKVQLTVSIGLACYPHHAQSSREIIKLADEAMYVGKNKSRNIIVVAS